MAFAPALLAPPDEQTQDAATVATALDPVAVAESQVLPPPLPAAPALPPDALMALASAPPPVAPQTPVDAVLAPALPPAGGPALSVLPPPDVAAGTPGTPVEAAKKRAGEVDALGREIQQLGDERTTLETQQAAAKAEHDRQKAEALSKLQERQELHRTQAANTVAELRSKAESEPYHTFWESRSIGQNIATGIGLILGGVSWNAGHVNRGIQIVENMMAQDLALQKEKHADLWRAVEAAERGERALDSRELRETAAFSAAQGAKADAIAGRLGAMIAANKGKGDTATAKKAMLTLAMQADQHYQNATSAEAAAAHLKEMDEETARHHREQEATSLLRAQKYKTKGGGGTGTAGSSIANAAVTLQEEIQAAAVSGKPMGRADIDRRAVALKIPLVGKAGSINARQIALDAQGAAAKEGAQDARELKLTEADNARIVRDTKGNPLGMAAKANQVAKIANDLAAQEKYLKLIDELATDVEKNGTIIDDPEHPRREKAKHRMSIFAEVQALGRVLAQLQATDAGTRLEHQMIGNSGVSMNPFPSMLSPKVLRELGSKNAEQVQGRLKAQLTPLPSKSTAPGKSGPPSGSKAGFLSDGRPAWKYPDGSTHLADGSSVDVL